jgi:uncharacterized membrane protein YeiH
MQLIEIFIYLGIVAAGISGAVVGIQKEMDLFGVTSLCVATSLGGGASLAAGLLTWVFYPYISRFNNLLMVSDAVGLGVFTAVGAKAAIGLGYDEPFIILSMGLITGIGGGVVRDVFSREIPYVFRKEVYAVASILGAGSLALVHDYVPVTFAMYSCLLITFLVRVLCVMYSVNFPVYRFSDRKHGKQQEG